MDFLIFYKISYMAPRTFSMIDFEFAARAANRYLCRLVSLNPESCHSHGEEAVRHESLREIELMQRTVSDGGFLLR